MLFSLAPKSATSEIHRVHKALGRPEQQRVSNRVLLASWSLWHGCLHFTPLRTPLCSSEPLAHCPSRGHHAVLED